MRDLHSQLSVRDQLEARAIAKQYDQDLIDPDEAKQLLATKYRLSDGAPCTSEGFVIDSLQAEYDEAASDWLESQRADN